MAAVLYVVVVLAACSIYTSVCVWVLVFITTPLSLMALVAGLAAGAAVGLQRTLVVFAGRYRETVVCTPERVANGALPGRVRPEHVRRDRAWPQYFAMQAWLDLSAAASWTVSTTGTAWRLAARPLLAAERRKLWFAWPLWLVGAAALLGFTVGAAAIVALTAAVVGSVTGSAWAVGLPVVLSLRAADRAWQGVFRAGGSCPRCYEVTPLPAYRCPGRHSAVDYRNGYDLHRDIRPGRLGVWWRRCACGERLPTTVLRAARRLEARCPTCTEPLHPGAALATDVRIPVFGASSSGKTHLIMAGLVSLLAPESSDPTAPGVVLVDDYSRRRYGEYLALINSGQSAPKTSAAQQPVAVTVGVRNGRRDALVHIFDAAGEALVDATQNASYAYLDYARTLVFVLDPFAVPDVRDQYAATFADVFREANPAQHDPEDSYQATVTRLRRYGVDTARKRLAFVLSKADLVQKLPIAGQLGPDSASVRGWLVAHGLDNLVISAERDFQEVEFFLVSSKDLSDVGAIAPLRWLLGKERVPVPSRPSAPGPGGSERRETPDRSEESVHGA